ncbi:uncharacterized protein [Rutidosis leptorrhynchoides]|uniref:uncharacterized protein n=1 Tax=Rutidosis leptorrhynchoides TaxID=125765 RepID=UPI003A9A0920
MAPSGKYDKIYTVTSVHHLIPIKLDLAKLNYTHRSTLFATHCHRFNVHQFLEASSYPPDEEISKADVVVLGWIFLTISETLLERLLSLQPKTAFAAWEFLKTIFQDNKHSKIVELTTELRSLNIGDLTVEQYFLKVESLFALLTNLGSKIDEDQLVTYAINALSERFPHAHHIILHSNPFPSFDTVQFMITLEEMQVSRKSRTNVEASHTPSAPTTTTKVYI